VVEEKHEQIIELPRRKTLFEIFDTISFVAFCILIADCAFSGAGRWLMIGSLSIRMTLGLITLVCAIPAIFKGLKCWIKNPMIIGMALFLVYLAICAFIGINKGNRTDVLMSDIKGFSWLFLVPVALAEVNTQKRLVVLMKFVIGGTLLQAFIIVGLNILSIFYPNLVPLLQKLFATYQIGVIGNIASNMIRIYVGSCPYLIVGCVSMIYIQISRKKFSLWYALATGVCINAMLLTFTRSLYGAALITFILVIVLYLVFSINLWKRLLVHVLTALFIAAIFVAGQQVLSGANYMQMALARTFSIGIINENSTDQEVEPIAEATMSTQTTGAAQSNGNNINEDDQENQQQEYLDRTEDSDAIRATTLSELKQMIKQNPVFGNGLGSAISFRKDGLVEYFYYDIINKMGIVGLVLYYMPIAYMVLILLRQFKKSGSVSISIAWLCSLAAFMAITYFNPYMNAVLGISCYSIVIACFTLFWYDIRRFSEQ